MKINFNEKHLSQIPVLQLLANLGYEILSQERAFKERGENLGNVLLEDILRGQLREINRINYAGKEHPFSEANIHEAVQKIKNIRYEGLQKTNAKIYDLITLGAAQEQTVEGRRRSFTLNYIDWENPRNNVFHATAEFPVERRRSDKTVRPDIVLFINGMPLGVIECKAPGVEVEQAVSQNIRNQGDEYIPELFVFVQLVMAVNGHGARYGTAGASADFWSVWKEMEYAPENVAAAVNKPLSQRNKDAVFSGEFAGAGKYFDDLEDSGRETTGQDAAIHSLCSPERLADLTRRFIVFEHGEKKIARYQQFFVVKETLKRIAQRDEKGRRKGGIIWQTQGSGKSLTMVMLARALALEEGANGCRMILVTDRKDLDKQLANTFTACGLGNKRAASGRELVKHLRDKVDIVTSLVHKFVKGMQSGKYSDDSTDIFVLADESHRTQYGNLSVEMRGMLPGACYIGFTGTPLTRKDRNTYARFGSLIQPHYSIRRAVEDKAVVPLLYEGRLTDILQNKKAIDLWFERHTADLNPREKADLKRKYSRANMIVKADPVIHMQAFDISEHYKNNWQNTGFKAQLVAPDKDAALKYHECLKQFGDVSSEVIISAPDDREGHGRVGEAPAAVAGFWKTMMELYGSEDEYNKLIVERFREADEPEILIVVDKLLTGFDAPRNAVMYLCRSLKEHTLLQAIARVNRLHEGKEFGYIIDYASVLENLDKALTAYDALKDYDAKDLEKALVSIDEAAGKLPERRDALLDIFKGVENRKDAEAVQRHLEDEELRDEFYDALSEYARTLGIALSSEKFIAETNYEDIKSYKEDLKEFQNLKNAVRLRYADAVQYGKHEPKIKKLLDTHLRADEVHALNEPVDIFDDESVKELLEDGPVYAEGGKSLSNAAKADAIANALKKAVQENMQTDPALYEKFSGLIQQAIDDFKQRSINGLGYLNRVMKIREEIKHRRSDDVPERIRGNAEASAYYGQMHMCFDGFPHKAHDNVLVEMALHFKKVLEEESVVNFWDNPDAINRVKVRFDDFYFDVLRDRHQIRLDEVEMNEVTKKILDIAGKRAEK